MYVVNRPRPVRVAMAVPPPSYLDGVPRRMCTALVDALTRDGHDVVTGPAGELLPDGDVDLVHVHTAAAVPDRIPVVRTVHEDRTGPLDGPILVAVSYAQQRRRPDVPWDRVVHYGVEAPGPRRHGGTGPVLWLGRMRPSDGPDLAVAACRAAGLPLVLAGRYAGPGERHYYRAAIVPLLGADTRVVLDPTGCRRERLLAAAGCLLAPARCGEPAGVDLLDAMGAGVPVVATTTGPAPELVRHGETGLLCGDLADLPSALRAVAGIDPATCVRHVRERFPVAAMTRRYVELYRRVRHDHGIDAQPRPAPRWPVNG